MKTFDLELAKAGHPVQTRDGDWARVVCYDRCIKEYPIVALIGKEELPFIYRKDGTHEGSDCYDLFMAPFKREGWVNLYKDSNGAIICKYHKSKEDAFRLKQEGCIATTKIEWEE